MREDNAAWRRENLGYRLFAANDRFLRDKLRVVAAGGFPDISDALLALFVNVDPGGTRVTEIARRAGLAKQSVTELVNRAEYLDLVGRASDPDDLRARIVRFTPQGNRVVERLRQAIDEAESACRAIVGTGFADEFKARFGAYSVLPVEGGEIVGDATGLRAGSAWRGGNVGRVFALASRRFAREALGRVHARSYREVGEGLLALFRNLDLDGTRLTDLAARAHITKQSMRELVDRAETLGFVARCLDAKDQRAKIIAFTGKGRTLLDTLGEGIAGAEVEASRIVGADFLTETKLRLSAYAAPPTFRVAPA